MCLQFQIYQGGKDEGDPGPLMMEDRYLGGGCDAGILFLDVRPY